MQGAIAVNRFGYGLRPGEQMPADPQAWLLGQFERYDPRPGPIAMQPRTAEAARLVGDLTFPTPPDGVRLGIEERRARARELNRIAERFYADGVRARLDAALQSDTPFVERLVHFWSNHFAVSGTRGRRGALAASLEFDAVRPHVLGRFEDLLFANIRHPALLDYLDQVGSMGPNSPAAIRRNSYRRRMRQPDEFGSNENFAREVLELHTLGVNGGYTQKDVIEFAYALSGWSVSRFILRTHMVPAESGSFVFHPAWHEPGNRVVMGRTYSQRGEAKGVAILKDLAAHPSTARHISWKLARHFVADDPPEALVARMADRFLASGGDLAQVYAVMVTAPEAWQAPVTKVRTPWDWSVASLRALGVRSSDGLDPAGMLSALGQPVWSPGSPAGYPDIAGAWAGANMMLQRVRACGRLVEAAGGEVDAAALASRLFGDGLSSATRREIARADDNRQALALLFLSREFYRR